MAQQKEIPHVFRFPSVKGVDLNEVSISRLQKYYEKGTFTTIDYVRACLERIRNIG